MAFHHMFYNKNIKGFLLFQKGKVFYFRKECYTDSYAEHNA